MLKIAYCVFYSDFCFLNIRKYKELRLTFLKKLISSKKTPMKQIIFTDKAPVPIGPYSQAVLAGNTLYVSGQIAAELATEGDLKAEAHKIMENIGSILSEAAMDYTNIVKTSIFLKNMDDFGLVNEVYGGYFLAAPPARETIQVARLPKDVNIEISVIAVK